MPIEIKTEDYVLRFSVEKEVNDIINKYDSFLDILSSEDYSFQKEAIKKCLSFFISSKYKNISDLAEENYSNSEVLKKLYTDFNQYILNFPISDKKICSIDLATGTGKSYVIYGVAILMLAEKIVDRVLVLCPSLTIENGLISKFNVLNSDKDIQSIIKEIKSTYIQPEIVSATGTILENCICVENIHATYQRTGSSITDSLKGSGEKTLIINDEAHHVFSGLTDNKNKKWKDFIIDIDYNFKYILNLSGTPYYMGSDKYFFDVVYRFSIKDAVNKKVVKKVDYKKEEEYKKDKGFQDTYVFHIENKKKYGKYLKPITIVVTDRIVTAVEVWKKLIDFLVLKENITEEEATKKVIWVTSGIPSNQNEKDRINSLISNSNDTADKIRRNNLELLKYVDEPDNEVEWIVSVSMLTEGWDVKNVFLVVPHEQKAFNSKLLIAQVLGRGLRLPHILKENNIEAFLKVNNHEKWTNEIEQLYNEVLEIENKLSWGYDSKRSKYIFPLYNLKYESKETSSETKEKPAKSPNKFGFKPQNKTLTTTDKFAFGESIKYTFEEKAIYDIDEAVNYLFVYLKEKNNKLVKEWTKKKLKNSIVNELKKIGSSIDFLSKENFIIVQQAFGPLFRELGKETPRLSQVSDSLYKINIADLPTQYFSEDSLKTNGKIFYDDKSSEWYSGEEKILFNKFIDIENEIKILSELISEKVAQGESILDESIKLTYLSSSKKELEDDVCKIETTNYKSPLNIIYVAYTPERTFVDSLFNNIDLFDSFIKSTNKGYYYFPYSYKPETIAKTHVKQDNFNPDFFLKVADKNEILVVEIKKEGDDSKKNKAKYRDGSEHFKNLNNKLIEEKIDYNYYFYFLSPENDDIVRFFQSVRENKYKKWGSSLMIGLK